MSDSQELPDKVSQEAHARVKGERDALKAQLDQATNAITDMKLLSEAQGYFTNKVSDPVTAAEMVLPKLRGIAPEDRQGALEASVPLFAPVQGIVSESPPPTEGAVEVAPVSPPTPAFMRPNPASDGPPPGSPTFTMQSPEVVALANQGPEGAAEIRRMIGAGEIKMHPGNRSAQALNR